MAKKKATRGDFNMSEEVRNILGQNSNLKASEVLAALQKKFPNFEINEGSFKMAFYSARKKLGVTAGRSGKTVPKSKPKAAKVNMDALQAAAKLIGQVGDADAAVEAVKQVRALQVK